MINTGIPITIGSTMASTTGLESSVSDDGPPPLLRTPGTKGAIYSQKKTTDKCRIRMHCITSNTYLGM